MNRLLLMLLWFVILSGAATCVAAGMAIANIVGCS